MKTELILKFEFVASHSLAGYEAPHPHLWKLEVVVEGEPIQGFIVDMVVLRESVQSLITPLESTFLNDCQLAGASVMAFPTCETLSQFFCSQAQDLLQRKFIQQNPTLRVAFVTVAICDAQGSEMGAVRLTPSKTL